MRILEASLLSTDLAATRTFYNNILGLKTVRQARDSITFLAGNSLLSFQLTKILKPVYHFAFNVLPSRLAEILNHLQEKVAIMPVSPQGKLIADFESWNAKSFYYHDNNGNILECIARMDLEDQGIGFDDQRFILNISEIGLVVPDVPEAQGRLENHGIPLFSKGPQTPDFSVLGDDEALLILKDPERGWMPDLSKPIPFDTTVLVLQDEQQFRISLISAELDIIKMGKEIHPH
jgi:catechol 2,3-dioxygenase-like lactoylglutathione lyase family enzyme